MNQTEKILNQLIEELELAIIKAKAQLEYVDRWRAAYIYYIYPSA